MFDFGFVHLLQRSAIPVAPDQDGLRVMFTARDGALSTTIADIGIARPQDSFPTQYAQYDYSGASTLWTDRKDLRLPFESSAWPGKFLFK